MLNPSLLNPARINVSERSWTLESRSKIERINPADYLFEDFLSQDGVYRTRIISIDNIPHCPFGSMVAFTWEFLKHFS